MTSEGSDDNALRVDTDAVREAGRFAYRTAHDLLDALRSAGSDVEGLTNGGWAGVAATSYAAGWRELQNGGTQVFEALSNIAELLGVTAENYSQQDARTAQSISSLRLD